MSKQNKDFQQIVDEYTLSGVFTGTGVDEATQAALLEWFFNFPISDDDESTWLRYFRRRCKNIYPLYENRVRVSVVKGTMDPFVVDFLERTKNDREATTGSTTGNKSTHQITDDTTLRNPDLTTGTVTTETRTPDLRTSVNESGTKSDTQRTFTDTTETRDLASTEDSEVTADSKNRSFAVNYPEANLSGIPTDVDTYPASIDYVNSEADVLNKTTTEGDVDRTDTGTVETNSDTSVSSSGSTNGTRIEQETGSETRTLRSTTDETGYDRTQFDGDVSTTEDSTGSTNGSRSFEGQEIEQGRHESVADILPRAIAAISDSNDLIWLTDQLKPCFDIYFAI